MKKKAIEKIPYLTISGENKHKGAKYVGVTAFKNIRKFIETKKGRGRSLLSESCLQKTILEIIFHLKMYGQAKRLKQITTIAVQHFYGTHRKKEKIRGRWKKNEVFCLMKKTLTELKTCALQRHGTE